MVDYKVTFNTLSNEISRNISDVQDTFINMFLRWRCSQETDGSEVLVEMCIVRFRECNNCYRVKMFFHKPV